VLINQQRGQPLSLLLQRFKAMHTAMEIFESLVNGQARRATEQLQESNYSLYSLVDYLSDRGYSDSQILNEIKKLRV